MKTGMLVISHPNVMYRNLPKLTSEINNILYIQYFPQGKWNNNFTLKTFNTGFKKPNWPIYSSLIIGLYSKVLPYKHLDVRILLSGIKNQETIKLNTKSPVDYVCHEESFKTEDVSGYISSCVQNKASDYEILSLKEDTIYQRDENSVVEAENCNDNIYDNVVLGGTFDRLHYGHKILLSEALLRCRKKITVGVTDTPMLKSKATPF